jgi:hypothetical protein
MSALSDESARGDIEAQQAALDGTVPQGVRASRMNSECVAKLRAAGEHRGLPADKFLTQACAELRIQGLEL